MGILTTNGYWGYHWKVICTWGHCLFWSALPCLWDLKNALGGHCTSLYYTYMRCNVGHPQIQVKDRKSLWMANEVTRCHASNPYSPTREYTTSCEFFLKSFLPQCKCCSAGWCCSLQTLCGSWKEFAGSLPIIWRLFLLLTQSSAVTVWNKGRGNVRCHLPAKL